MELHSISEIMTKKLSFYNYLLWRCWIATNPTVKNYKFKHQDVFKENRDEMIKHDWNGVISRHKIVISFELFNYSKLYSCQHRRKWYGCYSPFPGIYGDDCTLSIITRKQRDNEKTVYISRNGMPANVHF
jgi:hypothetical protein